jgi:hypothetical protein
MPAREPRQCFHPVAVIPSHGGPVLGQTVPGWCEEINDSVRKGNTAGLSLQTLSYKRVKFCTGW